MTKDASVHNLLVSTSVLYWCNMQICFHDRVLARKKLKRGGGGFEIKV